MYNTAIIPMTRLTIQLPVTPLVYQILTHKYGPHIQATYRENKRLWKRLQVQPVSSANKRKMMLTKRIEITVVGKLAQNLKNANLCDIGLFLHEDYLTELYDWIHSQTLIGQPAASAMRSYFDRYGVGEDDFAYDSAYRGWLRFSEKNGEKTPFSSVPVRQNQGGDVLSFIEQIKENAKNRKVKAQLLETLVMKHFKIDDQMYRSSSRDHSRIDGLRTLIYLLRVLSERTTSQIGNIVQKAPSTVIHHQYLFERSMQMNETSRKSVHNLLEELKTESPKVLYYRHKS